jgi:MFS family permease
MGIGIGVSFPSLMSIAMSGATREDAGLASGLVNTTAQVGGALGLAVLATLSATRSDNLIADGKSTAVALTSGYHLAFLIGAILVAAAFVVGITVLQPEDQAAEEAGGDQRRDGEPAYSES